MASGNDAAYTPGESGSNGSYSSGSGMADKASTHTEELLPSLLNNRRARTPLTNGEASILNPNKKQKTSNGKSTNTYDVSATSATITGALTTTVTNTKAPITTTRGLASTTKSKAALSTTQTTTAPRHIYMTTPPKQERMTAASFFEEEEVVCLGEIQGTKRKHESTEASAPLPTALLPSTGSVVASYYPDPKILPEKIVLLIDRQDAYLKSFYYPNVLHIYDNKLNFGNAFSMIKKTENVFKNTLFVMLCGTMSVLKQEINKECHLFLCKEPLYNYSMQDFKAPSLQEHLINEAKALRTKIAAMENCDIIFSGLLPVRIDRAEAYEAERHYSQTGHQVRINSSRCEGLYSGLCAGLKAFNKWAKEDAELFGFPNWSLVDAYTAAISSAPQDSNQHCTDLTENGSNSSNDSRSKSPTADSSTHRHSDALKDIESIPLRDSSNLSQNSRTQTRNSSSFTGDSKEPTNPTNSNSSPNSPTESSTSCQPFTHTTEANGVTLTMECMLERRQALKTKVREIFLRVKKVTRPPKPPAPSVPVTKKDDKVVLPKLKSHQHAASHSSGDVNVVVVGDAKHNNILSNLVDPFLSSKKVTLITLQELNPDGMADIVHKYYSQVPWNTDTVWMLCFGVLDFIDLDVYPKCINLKCKSRLHCCSVKRDAWLGKFESKVKEVINTVNKFKSKLESGILSSTILVVVPPMQIAVLDEEAFKNHQKLHNVAKKHNLFLCNKVTYDLTKMFYSRLFEVWHNTFGKLVEGVYQKPMSDYITQCKNKSLNLFGEGLANVCNFGMEWKTMMEEVISIALKKHPLVLSGVKMSSYLSFLPFISLIESSPSIGKMLSLNLQKKPNAEDRLFRQVVVVGNQLPAELDELCHQLSIHVMPQRVTFDKAGKALIRKHQKLWPKGTLWVILSDILHMATLKILQQCVTRNCKEILKAYVWDMPRVTNLTKWKAKSELRIKDLIDKAKKFSESLTDNLGEGSAVFLPPVTPVFLLHANDQWEHKDLHKWYEQCKKAIPVFIGRKNLRKTFMNLKKAWVEMLKSYLEKYPVPMKILELYEQGKEDWIKTLGNFLVHFANAKKDIDDAVFSDAEFSSGEETVMGEEDTEDLADTAASQHPITVQFSTPSVAHTSRAAPVSAPAPALSPHPIPPTLVSAFPPYPKIAVRQDLLDKLNNTATILGSTLERTHWTVTSETPEDLPGTTENTQHKTPQRTLLETPVNIPQTSGNTSVRRLKRTLLNTPVKTPNIPVDISLKAHQKTVLGAPVEAPVQQHQHDKETVMMRMAQGPQQTVIEKDHLASNTEKGQLTPRAEGGLLITRTKEKQLTPKTKKGKLDPRIEKGKTGHGTSRIKKTMVIPQAYETMKTEVTARAEKGQVSPRIKKDQQANGTEKNEVTVKMKKNLGSQRQEKDQILRTEKDQVAVQGKDAVLSKEDQVIMERAQHIQRRLTFTEDVDADMSDDENNEQWIILSETEEEHEDALEKEDSGDHEEEDSPKDSSKKNEQDSASFERKNVNDLSKDTVTTLQTAAEMQSLIPKAKHSKDTTLSETPVKSHSVVSAAKNPRSKDSKDNNTTSTVVKHTKDNNMASSALEKLSKEANTVSADKHSEDSNTTHAVSEHSKNSNMEPLAEDKHKKSDMTPAVEKHIKDSNTALSAVVKNSTTAPTAIGKHSKKSSRVSFVDKHNQNNNTTPAAGENRKNSNKAPSALEKHKKSDTSLSAVDKHSKNSNAAPSTVDKNKNSDTTLSAKDKHCKNNNTAPPALDNHSKNSNTASPTEDKNKNSNTAPSAVDKNKNSNTAPSVVNKNKNSNTAPSTLDTHSKNSNTAPSAVNKNKNSNTALSKLDKHSKNSITAPSTVDKNKNSNTAPSTVDKHSKNSNTAPSTVDKNKNSSTAQPTVDKHNKNSNTAPSTVDKNKNSNTAQPTVDKHNKNSNTAPSTVDKNKNSSTAQPTVDKHNKNSNTAPSTVDKNKNSSTAQPTVDKHNKNSITAQPTVDKHNKNSITAPSTVDKNKNSNTAQPTVDKHNKNSITAQPTVDKHNKNSITAPSTVDKNKNSNTAQPTVDKHNKNSNTAQPTVDKHNKNSNTAPSTVDKNKSSDTASPTSDKHTNTPSALDGLSKDSNTVPEALNKHSNTAPEVQNKHSNTTPEALNKHSNTAPEAQNKHSNTGPESLDKHSKTALEALDEFSKESNIGMAQFSCLAKSHRSHNKDDICEAASERGIPPDPQETEEDSPDTEVLSDTDSVDTIILNNFELEQESPGHSSEECQPLIVETIPQIGSKPYSDNLVSPNEHHFVESELLQGDFVEAENLWESEIIKETEFVVGDSRSGGAGRGGSRPLGRKRKRLLSNESSPALSSSSASSSIDSDLMEGCFRKLLEHLRVTFQVLWHTYLLTPEAHPDFEEKLAEYCQQYRESNEGEAQEDPEHCEKAWRVFWKDWVKKQLEEEKQKSKQMLFESFRPMIKNFQRTYSANGENQPKRVKVDEGSKESHKFEGNCANTNTRLPVSVIHREENSQSLPHSPPRVNQKSLCVSENMSCHLSPGVDQVNSKLLSVSAGTSKQSAHSINIEKSRSLSPSTKGTTSTSHSLDSCLTVMSHCQWMISDISRAASDSEAAHHSPSLNTEAKERAKRRVRLILRCFKMLTEFGLTLGSLSPALVPIIKSVLDGGVQSDRPLDILSDPDNVQVMKMCSEKLRCIGEKAEGVYKEKLLQCSSDIDELLENISISVMSLEMIEGLHIPTIAQLTAQKDTPSVLEFVKDALAMRNMHSPPKSLVNKLFLAVSTYHSVMATQSSPTIAVTTSPATR